MGALSFDNREEVSRMAMWAVRVPGDGPALKRVVRFVAGGLTKREAQKMARKCGGEAFEESRVGYLVRALFRD